jgi:hypothetical protein
MEVLTVTGANAFIMRSSPNWNVTVGFAGKGSMLAAQGAT